MLRKSNRSRPLPVADPENLKLGSKAVALSQPGVPNTGKQSARDSSSSSPVLPAQEHKQSYLKKRRSPTLDMEKELYVHSTALNESASSPSSTEGRQTKRNRASPPSRPSSTDRLALAESPSLEDRPEDEVSAAAALSEMLFQSCLPTPRAETAVLPSAAPAPKLPSVRSLRGTPVTHVPSIMRPSGSALRAFDVQVVRVARNVTVCNVPYNVRSVRGSNAKVLVRSLPFG